MKQFIIGLLFPLFSSGQTVHHNGEKISYKGDVVLQAGSASEIRSRLQNVFTEVAGDMADSVFIQPSDTALRAYTSMRMNTPYHIIKKMHFTIQLTPGTNGYAYAIDSVYISEKRRGGKETLTPSKDLIEALEETGKAAIELEITLNEIDLRIQKLLRVLENKMQKESAYPGQSSIRSAAGGSMLP